MDYKDRAGLLETIVTGKLVQASRMGEYSSRRKAMLVLRKQPCAVSCPRAWWDWYSTVPAIYK